MKAIWADGIMQLFTFLTGKLIYSVQIYMTELAVCACLKFALTKKNETKQPV